MGTKLKLVFIEPIGVEKEELFRFIGERLSDRLDIMYYDTRVEDSKTLIERGRDADIIAVSNLPLNREVLNGCPKLKMLAVAFTGVDHIAMDVCRERKITVCNCAGYSDAAVSDLVFGLIINIYRNIIVLNQVVREEGTKNGYIGFELEGKKFGVIGTGAIGTRVVKLAAAFGCEVYAWSRTEKELADVTYVDFDTLLKTCDIISLHVPLNETTRGLIGKDQLKLMKNSAILINTARGPIVDSEALKEALNEGEIAAAGVDVFEVEPPVIKTHPLFEAKNLVATPHVAFATKEALVKRAQILLDNIDSWLDKSPKNIIM